MKRIFLVILLLSTTSLLCAQNRFVDGWKMEFWQLKPLSGDYLTVSKGDTMVISWDQPLSNQDYEEQPSFGIGDTTGNKKMVDIPFNNVSSKLNPDSTLRCVFKKDVDLSSGSWALIIYSYRGSLISRHSRPFWFRVSERPPMLPIEVKIFIKR